VTGYKAQYDCFATVSEMSVIFDILYNIFFKLKYTKASRLDMESEKIIIMQEGIVFVVSLYLSTQNLENY